MEASGNPPSSEDPAAQPSQPAAPPPPPPPPPVAADAGKAGAGWRILAVILALALLFAGAVMIAVAVDLLDTPVGIDACRAEPGCTEYYGGSSGERAIQVGLAFISGGFAVLAAIWAFVFAITGRRGAMLLRLTGIAIAFGVASIVFGAVFA